MWSQNFCLPSWTTPTNSTTPITTPGVNRTRCIDSHPSGYPRFSALLSTYDPFILCRRFTRIRARLLLLKQDKLAMLEQRLDEVDLNETSPLFLGKSRSDMNADRISLLAEIEISLADYDQFADRTHRMLGFTPARERDIQSLCNWTEGTGCLAREETAYLTHPWELTSLAPAGDNAMVQLEAWIEDKLIRFYRGFHQHSPNQLSQDTHVYSYCNPLVQRSAKALLLFLITCLLLMPIVVCNIIASSSVRMTVVIASTISYLLIISRLTKPRTTDLIIAGATYATVLIVFVSGSQ